MSLINEALKKAQKQRTGEAPALASLPTIGGEAPRRIAHRPGSPAIGGLLLKIGLGAGGLVLVVTAGVLLLRDKSGAPAPTAVGLPAAQAAPPSAPAATASAPATESKPAPAGATPAAQPAANAFVLPIAAPPEPTKAAATPPRNEPTVEAPKNAVPAPVVKPRDEPAVAAAKISAAPPARLEPRAMDFIDSIRVAGIRASATDAKVLMNDRVYRVGDTVEREMGLRLVGITANSLTFEDERGGRYTRNF